MFSYQFSDAAAHTIHGCRLRLARFQRYLAEQGVSEIHEVTPGVLSTYQTVLLTHQTVHGRPLSAHTRAGYITILRSFFRFLTRAKLILINPAADLEIPKTIRRPPAHILGLNDVKRLLRAPDTRTVLGIRDRAMLELFYSTGMRAGEMAQLEITDLDLSEGELTIQRGKGGRSRRIPVGPEAIFWVRKYLTEARPQLVRRSRASVVFLTVRGRRIHPGNLTVIVRQHGETAGLAIRVFPHLLRHTCATHMLRGKASLRHVQEMLGHADLGTTQIYTKVDISDLKAVHRRCHPRGRR